MTREEAIQVIKNTSINIGRQNGKHLIQEAMNMAIEALEREKGEWLFGRQIDGAYDVYGIKSGAILCRCSKCNFAHAFIDGHSSQYHFCPNCGSEMRERREDGR